MITEAEITALAEAIVHGAEERYVAELTNLLIDNLMAGVFGSSDSINLDTLARGNAVALQTALMAHRGAISAEVMRSVEDALMQADERDVASLNSYYGSTAATATGYSAHFAEIAHQTARGLSEIISRQNIAMSTNAEKLWYEVAGEAITAVNHGLKPRDKVIADAVAKLAAAGVETIDYKSGISNQPDVAARRHIVSQVSQAGGRMTMERLDEVNHTLVITTSHFGARPSHAAWQGRPCSTKGTQTVDGVRYPDIHDLCGYGTAAGLKGVNCRHAIGPYFPGITELPDLDFPDKRKHFNMTSEEYFDATQRQRELERRVRKTKREVAALERAGLGLESPSYVQKRLVLGKQQGSLRAHVADKGLVRQYGREKAYGVGAQPRALKNRAYWSASERKSYTLANLSSFEAKYRGTTDREVGMVFGPSGEEIQVLGGGSGHGIRFSLPKGRKWGDVSVAHTHPDAYGGTFSMEDMFFVTDSGVGALHAVCREGTYSISPGQKSKAKSLMRAYDKAYQATVEGSLGSTNRTRYVREAMHAWLSGNAGKYGFEYTFKVVQ